MKRYTDLMRALQTSQFRLAARHPARASEAWLYAASAEAVLIVDLATHAIAEANPAAAKLLGFSRDQLLGMAFLGAFGCASAELLRAGAETACAKGCSFELIRCAAVGGAALEARISLVRTGPESYLLVHVNARAMDSRAGREASPNSLVLDLLEEMSDGFVVTDLGLHVDYANRAFAAMSGGGVPVELNGENLARWLEFTQCDLAALATQQSLRQVDQVLRLYLRPTGLAPREVEVRAIAVPDGPHACWGFRIRDLREALSA